MIDDSDQPVYLYVVAIRSIHVLLSVRAGTRDKNSLKNADIECHGDAVGHCVVTLTKAFYPLLGTGMLDRSKAI